MPGLRVAVDVTPLLGVRTGVYQCVEHLLDSLPAAAPEIDVVPYVLSRRARDRAAELPPGCRFLPMPAGLAVRTWGVSRWPSVARQLGDVDVVHGTNFVVPPSAQPSTVTVHDAFCLVHPDECDRSVRPFDRAVRRAVTRGAWLHVSTHALERELRSRYGASRVVRVPFAVPSLDAPGPLPPAITGPYVLAISTLDARKRHAHLVRAFGAMAATNPGLQLVLAGGDGNATAAVVGAIRALPREIERRVVCTGRVDGPTRAALLRGATVLAYPSADEGFGFPVLEAMAAGVPVVATDVGGIPEVSGDAALLVPVDDDPGALANALTQLVTDDALRARLREQGRARAASFSWADHARGMADLWHRAAEAGG